MYLYNISDVYDRTFPEEEEACHAAHPAGGVGDVGVGDRHADRSLSHSSAMPASLVNTAGGFADWQFTLLQFCTISLWSETFQIFQIYICLPVPHKFHKYLLRQSKIVL